MRVTRFRHVVPVSRMRSHPALFDKGKDQKQTKAASRGVAAALVASVDPDI